MPPSRHSLLPIDFIAAICHDANRRLQLTIGEAPSETWENSTPHIRQSATSGVADVLEGVTGSPEEQHESWMRFKINAGWGYGPVKDEVAKTHPCLVPYSELPIIQRAKDSLFRAIVMALSSEIIAGVAAERGFPTDDILVRNINSSRGAVKDVARDLKNLKADVTRGHFAARPDEDRGEILANLMLSYRHLEDASMRLGKAIQARDGGTSVYDKETTVGVES